MYGIGPSSPQRRSFTVIIGVMALVLLVGGLFYVFYTLVLNPDDEAATPDPEATLTSAAVGAVNDTPLVPTNTATAVRATPTRTARATPPPTDTPRPTPTLRPPPDVITTGVRARVNISEGLAINLRDMPTLSGSTVITQLLAGAEVDVVDGPEDVGDLRWWNVNGGEDRIGWVVEAFGGETWLLPVGWSDQLSPLSTAVVTGTPAASPTATVPATAEATAALTPTLTLPATATVAPQATALVSPTATPLEGIASPTIGGRAEVTTRFQFVNLRAGPGLSAETIGQLADGTIVTVLEGPEEADNIRWWKVEDEAGNVGWAAERVTGEVLLVPVGAAAPSPY